MQDFNNIEMSENKRSMTLDNGNKINFTRKDPYGFWFISYEKGQVPESLQGAYTSYDRALVDVKGYLTQKQLEKKTAKPKETKAEAA